MKEKTIRIKINSISRYVRILNGLFSLTDKEILVISKFIEKHQQLKKAGINAFTSEVKKQVAKELDMPDFNVLNTYIKNLKDKNALRLKDGDYQIHPILLPNEDEEAVKFIWQINKNLFNS